ncbi:MAG: peptide chain release factor N(5)-glutamine methyltransferase [Bacteroidales bacterium]|nr:peptide chain release factor N(5)-glutamine methyltransferase [Bacteroidales bacterium]
MITLKNYIKQLETCLSKLYSEQEAGSIAEFFVCELLGFNRTEFLLKRTELLSEQDFDLLETGRLRLENGEPVQYVTHTAWFYNHKFYVDENVLIPRQETEILVDSIIKGNSDSNLRILDIGTGSGCIPICLKLAFPQSEVFALDIFQKALNVAKKNATNHIVDIDFFEFDILSDKNIPIVEKLDVIISNPPYVTESEKTLMHKNVLDFEPEIALFVKDDSPFIYYESIVNRAAQMLNDDGVLWLEINEKFPEEISNLCKKHGFNSTNIIKDLNNKPRFIQSYF